MNEDSPVMSDGIEQQNQTGVAPEFPTDAGLANTGPTYEAPAPRAESDAQRAGLTPGTAGPAPNTAPVNTGSPGSGPRGTGSFPLPNGNTVTAYITGDGAKETYTKGRPPASYPNAAAYQPQADHHAEVARRLWAGNDGPPSELQPGQIAAEAATTSRHRLRDFFRRRG